MRPATLFVLALVVGSAATLPSTAHAAGYRSFSSPTCGYSIDYPTGWKVDHSTSGDSFLKRSSPTRYAAVAVLCGPASARMTTKSVTATEIASYNRTHWFVGKPSFSHGFGIFTAHKQLRAGSASYIAEVEITAGVHGKKQWAFLYSADSGSFKQSLPVYVHMLGSFTTM